MYDMRMESNKGMSHERTMHLSYKAFQVYNFFGFEMCLEVQDGINFSKCIYKQCNSTSEPAICCL